MSTKEIRLVPPPDTLPSDTGFTPIPEGFKGVAEAIDMKFGRQILRLTQTEIPLSGDLPRAEVYEVHGLEDRELQKMNPSEKGNQNTLDLYTAKLHDELVAAEELGLSPEETEVEVKTAMDSLEGHISVMQHVREQTERGKPLSGTDQSEVDPANPTIETADKPELIDPDNKQVRGSRLPMMKDNDIVKILRNAGFEEDRHESGSHALYRHPNGRTATLVVGHPGDVAIGTRDSIFDQAGINDPVKFK